MIPHTLRSKFPEFEFLEELGRGSLSRVYLVRKKGLNRKEVLKVLMSNEIPQHRESLENEAEIIGTLTETHHPNMLNIYDIISREDCLALRFEYAIAEELGEQIKNRYSQGSYFRNQEAADIVLQVLSALDHCHNYGIIHLDVKPHNILITNDDKVLLNDWGVSRISSSLGSTRSGTPLYMSPEQLVGSKPDPRMDIYSTGVVLYELLSGTTPWNLWGTPKTDLMHQKRLGHIFFPSESRADERLEEIVQTCLRPDPDDRYQTISEMEKDLTAYKQYLSRRRFMKHAAGGIVGISALAVSGKLLHDRSLNIQSAKEHRASLAYSVEELRKGPGQDELPGILAEVRDRLIYQKILWLVERDRIRSKNLGSLPEVQAHHPDLPDDQLIGIDYPYATLDNNEYYCTTAASPTANHFPLMLRIAYTTTNDPIFKKLADAWTIPLRFTEYERIFSPTRLVVAPNEQVLKAADYFMQFFDEEKQVFDFSQVWRSRFPEHSSDCLILGSASIPLLLPLLMKADELSQRTEYMQSGLTHLKTYEKFMLREDFTLREYAAVENDDVTSEMYHYSMETGGCFARLHAATTAVFASLSKLDTRYMDIAGKMSDVFIRLGGLKPVYDLKDHTYTDASANAYFAKALSLIPDRQMQDVLSRVICDHLAVSDEGDERIVTGCCRKYNEKEYHSTSLIYANSSLVEALSRI